MTTDCAIFFTHQWSPALAKHFARLKRETAGVIDVFLVLHTEPDRPVPPGMDPDLTISLSDAERQFPNRAATFRQRASKGDWTTYVDTLWITAFLHDRLAAYDRFWLVEYDVDLKGHWGRFFAAAADYEGDLLTTRLRHLSQEPRWHHARRLQVPEHVIDPLIGLFCITRMSRPVAEGYRSAVAAPGWSGHFEALIPSFAQSAGFQVAELSGEGDWTPAGRRDLHYSGGWSELAPLATTYSFNPPRAYRYLGERGPQDRDTIYHPIKLDVPFQRRLHFMRQNLRENLRAIRKRARRALQR